MVVFVIYEAKTPRKKTLHEMYKFLDFIKINDEKLIQAISSNHPEFREISVEDFVSLDQT